VIALAAVMGMAFAVQVISMDANQFQGFVVAWGAALTTLIGVLLGLALAVRSAVAQLFTAHAANATALAAVQTQSAVHEEKLNGSLEPRIAAVVDTRISEHRRPGDNPTPA